MIRDQEHKHVHSPEDKERDVDARTIGIVGPQEGQRVFKVTESVINGQHTLKAHLYLCVFRMRNWRAKEGLRAHFWIVLSHSRYVPIFCGAHLDAVGGHVLNCLLRVSVRTKGGYVALCHPHIASQMMMGQMARWLDMSR